MHETSLKAGKDQAGIGLPLRVKVGMDAMGAGFEPNAAPGAEDLTPSPFRAPSNAPAKKPSCRRFPALRHRHRYLTASNHGLRLALAPKWDRPQKKSVFDG